MNTQVRTKFFLSMSLAAACLATALLGQQGQTQPAAADISGKWHFVFQTEGGPREFDATFQQNGDKVTGKWADKDDVKGTFSAGKLALEFAADSDEAGPGTLKIDGDLADDALTGTWSFQSYDGTFKATRSKPAAS
jgi:hypothetical protein